jgi:type II secretory ATPase GspE/PulE/Tfp pilus assembly ATPase PilB-like protein
VEPAGGQLVAGFGPAADGIEAIHRGAGCPDCRGTGYRGRTGIFELLRVDDAVRAALQSDSAELRRRAVVAGMRTLREDGLRHVRAGVTTPEEVLRVTKE